MIQRYAKNKKVSMKYICLFSFMGDCIQCRFLRNTMRKKIIYSVIYFVLLASCAPTHIVEQNLDTWIVSVWMQEGQQPNEVISIATGFPYHNNLFIYDVGIMGQAKLVFRFSNVPGGEVNNMVARLRDTEGVANVEVDKKK